ncbi:DMT family transporter [Thalassospira marina]|uniref:EamA family transporter n=1 Tax=Thalassospira marina TaxID=2048283 RepID=A0A2N3KGX5_9PROT|nr:EamA family transporter [Thalassospira marina]PKR49746.1 EamA family transporter [Thalassospira marina]
MGPIGLYAAVVLIWGSTWIAIKYQLSVTPELAVAYRFVLAALLLMAFCAIRKLPMRYSRRDHGFMALMGLCLFSLNYVFLYIAEAELTSGLIAVVFSAVVIMNMVNGFIFFKRRPEMRTVIGAVIGLGGICVIFAPDLAQFDLAAGGSFALVLSLLASYIASLGNMVSARNQARGIPVMQANAYGMMYGSVFLVVYILATGQPIVFDSSPSFLIALVYLAVFGSILGFGFYLTLLGRIGADRAAYSSVMFPVVALAISTFAEGFVWHANIILGVGLTLVGNVVILTRRRKAAKTQDIQVSGNDRAMDLPMAPAKAMLGARPCSGDAS